MNKARQAIVEGANEFAAPNGLSVSQVEEVISMIGERFTVCARGIASYDPQYDKEDEVLNAGVTIMVVLTPSNRAFVTFEAKPSSELINANSAFTSLHADIAHRNRVA
jgi:hypothetical protein